MDSLYTGLLPSAISLKICVRLRRSVPVIPRICNHRLRHISVGDESHTEKMGLRKKTGVTEVVHCDLHNIDSTA